MQNLCVSDCRSIGIRRRGGSLGEISLSGSLARRWVDSMWRPPLVWVWDASAGWALGVRAVSCPSRTESAGSGGLVDDRLLGGPRLADYEPAARVIANQSSTLRAVRSNAPTSSRYSQTTQATRSATRCPGGCG